MVKFLPSTVRDTMDYYYFCGFIGSIVASPAVIYATYTPDNSALSVLAGMGIIPLVGGAVAITGKYLSRFMHAREYTPIIRWYDGDVVRRADVVLRANVPEYDNDAAQWTLLHENTSNQWALITPREINNKKPCRAKVQGELQDCLNYLQTTCADAHKQLSAATATA